MSPEGEPLEALLRRCGALQTGHFVLSSGLHSSDYVQCARLLEDPARARDIGARLAERLASHRPESILSPALGALIIGHEVAASLDVPFRFTERVEGEMALRRGFVLPDGERVAVVEDVVTTGRSTGEAVTAAEAAGAQVVAVGAILDRSGGDPFGSVPFERLLELKLERYEPDRCPLCLDGGQPVRPGSRAAG